MLLGWRVWLRATWKASVAWEPAKAWRLNWAGGDSLTRIVSSWLRSTSSPSSSAIIKNARPPQRCCVNHFWSQLKQSPSSRLSDMLELDHRDKTMRWWCDLQVSGDMWRIVKFWRSNHVHQLPWNEEHPGSIEVNGLGFMV